MHTPLNGALFHSRPFCTTKQRAFNNNYISLARPASKIALAGEPPFIEGVKSGEPRVSFLAPVLPATNSSEEEREVTMNVVLFFQLDMGHLVACLNYGLHLYRNQRACVPRFMAAHCVQHPGTTQINKLARCSWSEIILNCLPLHLSRPTGQERLCVFRACSFVLILVHMHSQLSPQVVHLFTYWVDWLSFRVCLHATRNDTLPRERVSGYTVPHVSSTFHVAYVPVK